MFRVLPSTDQEPNVSDEELERRRSSDQLPGRFVSQSAIYQLPGRLVNQSAIYQLPGRLGGQHSISCQVGLVVSIPSAVR